jgi:hypothetical protein
MAKWQKPKDSKALAERKIYSQIKKSEKPVPPPTGLSEVQESLRLHFARYCWINRQKKAPSGEKWGKVFEQKWGMTLKEYERLIKRHQKERREAHSKSVDHTSPLP